MNARPVTDLVARAEAAMRHQAAETMCKVIEAETDRLVSEPWRITRAVYGIAHLSIWPPREGMTATHALCECRAKIAATVELGRAGHYAYDLNRHIALRQAEQALLRLITREAA